MPILLFCLIPFLVWGQVLKNTQSHEFSGRISRLNAPAKLARIKTNYANIKFLNSSDRLIFWNESYPQQRCLATVEGRTNEYLLVKILRFEDCIRNVHFTTGSYLKFESEDLKNSIDLARELVEILQKKRLATEAKKERNRKELERYVEKVDAVNKRYEILRQKLELEWQKELALLEEDKASAFTEFKQSEAMMNEIDTKLELYRIEDHNLKLDRWSLDPALYIEN